MITVASARNRGRVLAGVLAILLTVIAGVVFTQRFVAQAEWWQLDHTVTHAPRPPLADLGPPPGPVTTSWQIGTPVADSGLPAYDRVAHTIVDGQLVIVSGRGLDVRDARTGRPRWHYRRREWALLGWANTGQVLAAYLERVGHRGDRLTVALDAVSGTPLWRQRGDVPAATDRTTLRWPASAGVVFVTGDGRHTLYGRSATTGRRLWAKRLAHGCLLPESAPYASASSETLAAFGLDCGVRDRVLAVDPRSGRTLFVRAAAQAAVAVAGDVTAVYDGTALSGYDRTGRPVLYRRGDEVCRGMCPIAVTGGRLLVADGPAPAPGNDATKAGDDATKVGNGTAKVGNDATKGGDDATKVGDDAARRGDGAPVHRLEAVDIASGRLRWHRDMPGYTALSVAGGLVYGLRSQLADPLLPAGIDVIDPETGDGTTVPAPLVVRPELDGARPWIAAGGGLLYVAVPTARPRPFGAARLVALRGGVRGGGPPELAGVRTDDWPDACSLLTGRDLPGGYTGEPAPVDVEDVRLRPSCTYRPHSGPPPEREAEALSVTVRWVAPDAGTASALFAAAGDTQSGGRAPVRAGDAAYALGAPSGTIVMRVGRVIVTVTAGRPETPTRLATTIAARLRARV